MGYTYYKHMVMIPDRIEFDAEQLYALIKQKFATFDNVNVNKHDNHIQIQVKQWVYHLFWVNESHVLIESEEIANIFAKKREDQKIIASSKIRIDGYGSADPDMEFFNYYVYVVEALETIIDVYHFQSDDRKIWKYGESY